MAALRAAGLIDRPARRSQFARCLDRVRRVEPSARVGISVGGWLSRRRHRWNRRVVQRLIDAIESGRFDCLMAHHRLVDSELVARMAAAGGEVYAWTVDSESIIERLALTGVAGITTNDPRLFGTRSPAQRMTPDVAGARVAVGLVARRDRGAEAVGRRLLLERVALGRVARDAVEDGPDQLGRGQAHGLDLLVDQQLHHLQLVERHPRDALPRAPRCARRARRRAARRSPGPTPPPRRRTGSRR